MNKKGFTLIELLVVITIIGILSGLIIVSLGDATSQAKEAKIKSALDQIRPIAQLHANANSNSFADLDTNPKIVSIFNEIVANGGTDQATGLKKSANSWCAYSKTPADSCMCVDSTGNVKTGTTATACNCDGYNKCPN